MMLLTRAFTVHMLQDFFVAQEIPSGCVRTMTKPCGDHFFKDAYRKKNIKVFSNYFPQLYVSETHLLLSRIFLRKFL